MDNATFLRRVGANIRKARWLQGLTQEEAAAGRISYRYYQEVERGERNPTLETLRTLSTILKVPVAVLVDVEPAKTDNVRAGFLAARPKAPKLGRRPRSQSRA